MQVGGAAPLDVLGLPAVGPLLGQPTRDVASPGPGMMCYHCHDRSHNWSKCTQLSMLPDAVRLQCIEQYKRITDAEKRMDKDRRRAARVGNARAGVPCM